MIDRHQKPPKRIRPVVAGMGSFLAVFFLAALSLTCVMPAMSGFRGVQLLIPFGGVLLLVQWVLFTVLVNRGKERRGHRHRLVWMVVVGMSAATATIVLAWCSDGGC